MVTVTAAGAEAKTIPVILTVTNGIGFSISPLALAFTGTVGSPNKINGVTIINIGSTALTVTWNDSIPWLVGTFADTVTIAPGASASITHTASLSGKTAGTYSGIATISGGGLIKQVPVTLAVVPSTVGMASLDWNATTDSDVVGYKLYGRASSEVSSAQLADLPQTMTSYTVTGLEPGTTYCFFVTAYNRAGIESRPSNEVSKSIY